MTLFKDMLSSDQTLFKNPVALDNDYVPKLIKFREAEQFKMAGCIKPLLAERSGKNLFIHGTPGVGKTLACRKVLEDLEEQSDEVYTFIVNCWQHDTSYKIILKMCDTIGYRMTFNKKTDQLFEEVKKVVNKKAAVFVFDEIDRAKDFDFLYMILEEIYKKSIFMITNFKDFLSSMDSRLTSRLMPETIDFKQYSESEIKGILRERIKYAFYADVFEPEAFEMIVDKTVEAGDVRIGIHLLREAATEAEDSSLKAVKVSHVEAAIGKLSTFKAKNSDNLEEDNQKLLDFIKENSGMKIGDLYRVYEPTDPTINYKAFQRKIKKLVDASVITVEKVTGGKEGSTTIVNYSTTKKLTEF